MIGIVGAPSGHDDVAAAGLRFLVSNLGIGIRHGKHDWIRRHRAHHVLGDRAFHRQSNEDVGISHRIRQSAPVGWLGEAFLVLVHALGAPLEHHALRVAENNVLVFYAQPHIMFGSGNARGAGAVENHADLCYILARNLQRIQQRSSRDDRSAMLVVVENRNLHRLAQGFLNVETLRGLDVLQINAAKGEFEQLANFDDLIRIVGVDFNVEDIYIRKPLEQYGFPFHDRLARQRPDVP